MKHRCSMKIKKPPIAKETLAEVIRKDHEELQRLMDTPPVVPEDVRHAARFAGSMKHSLFYSQFVEEAVAKAYKRGFEDSKKEVK